MSLDFVILDKDGVPDRVVEIGADLHQELISAAGELGLARFEYFSDYYADVVVDKDLSELWQQVQSLRSHTQSNELLEFLNRLTGLISYAKANGSVLYALAD